MTASRDFCEKYGKGLRILSGSVDAGCGQSPQALINAGFLVDYSW